jgi:hypothetical protein
LINIAVAVSYRSIVLPRQTPDVVQSVVRGAVEPLLSDVNAMLTLPQERTPAGVGCNIAIAQVLLAAVGGVSAVLYSAKGGSGAVFQAFLTDFYPWDAEPAKINAVSSKEAAATLYNDFRNPLAHSSGIPVFDVRGENRREYLPEKAKLRIDRIAFDEWPSQGLPMHRLLELESEPVRPPWLPVTLASDGNIHVLTVESLYWGLRCSIQRLCSDSARMAAAAVFFGK